MNLLKRIKNLWKLSEFEPKYNQLLELVNVEMKSKYGVEEVTQLYPPKKFTPAQIITKKKQPEEIIEELNN